MYLKNALIYQHYLHYFHVMPVTDGGTECTRHTSRTGAVSFDWNYQLDTNVLEKEKGKAPHPSQEMQVYRRECSGRINQHQQVAQTIP
jgi:hypothetical protein